MHGMANVVMTLLLSLGGTAGAEMVMARFATPEARQSLQRPSIDQSRVANEDKRPM